MASRDPPPGQGGQLLYALVSRGRVILVEHSQVTGNASLVALELLGKLPQSDVRVSYVADRHAFHCLVSGGLTYLCVSTEVCVCTCVLRRAPGTFAAAEARGEAASPRSGRAPTAAVRPSAARNTGTGPAAAFPVPGRPALRVPTEVWVCGRHRCGI
jgi:hypothetical protein